MDSHGSTSAHEFTGEIKMKRLERTREQKSDGKRPEPQGHDIFLRSYVVPKNPGNRKRQPREKRTRKSSKWPRYALVFDTESRITPDQLLTFGVYHLLELRNGRYEVTEEGVFCGDDLTIQERQTLEKYVRTAISDVPSFPPRFSLYSRSEFVRRIFWPAIKRKGALICGFNLPFDLSRLALAWAKGNKGEWSLTLSQYKNGAENRNYPRIQITPIDSKKAFIQLARPWKSKEWKARGKAAFLDIRTLAWALHNKAFSLKRLCNTLSTPNQKVDHEPTGQVTPEEIEYARQDVRCTADALNALKQEFDKHPIKLAPHRAYSPASMAKAYLDEMGIIRPKNKFAVSDEILGITMQSYYGGRSETRIRCVEVPVVPVDFTSQYPSSKRSTGAFRCADSQEDRFQGHHPSNARISQTRQIRKLLRPKVLERTQLLCPCEA